MDLPPVNVTAQPDAKVLFRFTHPWLLYSKKLTSGSNPKRRMKKSSDHASEVEELLPEFEYSVTMDKVRGTDSSYTTCKGCYDTFSHVFMTYHSIILLIVHLEEAEAGKSLVNTVLCICSCTKTCGLILQHTLVQCVEMTYLYQFDILLEPHCCFCCCCYVCRDTMASSVRRVCVRRRFQSMQNRKTTV